MEATEGKLFAAGLAESIGDYIDRAIKAARLQAADVVLNSKDEDTIEDIAARIMGCKEVPVIPPPAALIDTRATS